MTDQGSQLQGTSIASSRRFGWSAMATTDPPPDPAQAIQLQVALNVGPPSNSDTNSSYQRTYAPTFTSKMPSAMSQYASTSYAPSSTTRMTAPTNTSLSKTASVTLSKTTVPRSAALSKVASVPSATTCAGASEAWRSPCGAAGRDVTRCQKRIRDLIGKHETKNVELEKREGLLHRRLQMLECSMPAVMVWQAWRTQATPEAVHKLVAEAANSSNCKVSPSQHYDCRVREIEAQRKEAHRRAEEARCLWFEKEAALQKQEARLDLARQQQEKHRTCIEKLAAEARKLGAPCGECPGKPAVASESSLHSEDLECLSRLESLAEAEACMKRQIAELEAKEQAYMCALAKAEELCSNAPPKESTSRGFRDADSQAGASTKDNEAQNDSVRSEGVDRSVGGDSSVVSLRDQSVETVTSRQPKETMTTVSVSSKSVEALPKCRSTCVGRIHSQANKNVSTKGETRDKDVQSSPELADKSEATISSAPCDIKCPYCPCQEGMDTDKKGNNKCRKIIVARADILYCQDIVTKLLQSSELSKLPGFSKEIGELGNIIGHVLKTAVCHDEQPTKQPAKTKSTTSVCSQISECSKTGKKKKVCPSQTSSKARSSPSKASDKNRGGSKQTVTRSFMATDATVCLAERFPLPLIGSFQKSPDVKSTLKSKSSINISDRISVGTQASKRSQSVLAKTASKSAVDRATSVYSGSQKPSAATSTSRTKINLSTKSTPSTTRSKTIVPTVASATSKGPTSIKSSASRKTAASVTARTLGSKSVASASPSAAKSIHSASTKATRFASTQVSVPSVQKSKSLVSIKPSVSRTTVPSATRSKVSISRQSSKPSISKTKSKASLSKQPSKAKSVGSISAKSSRTKVRSSSTKSATVCPPPSEIECPPPGSKTSKSSAKSSETKSAALKSKLDDVPFALPCIAKRTKDDDYSGIASCKDSARSLRAADSQGLPPTSGSPTSGSPTSLEPTTMKQSSSVGPCSTKSKCTKSISGSKTKSKCTLTAPSLKSSEKKSQRSASPERFELKSASRIISSTTLDDVKSVPSGQSQTVSSGTQAGQYLATQRSVTSAVPSSTRSAAPTTAQTVASKMSKSSTAPSAKPSSASKPSAAPSAKPSSASKPSTAPSAIPSAVSKPSAAPSVVHSSVSKPSATPSAVQAAAKAAARSVPSVPRTVPSTVPAAVSKAATPSASVPSARSRATTPVSSKSSKARSGVPASFCPSAPHSGAAVPSIIKSREKSREISSKSLDRSIKSKEEKAQPAKQPSEVTTRSEVIKTSDLTPGKILGETPSKTSRPASAASSHRSVRSTCTPKDKSQQSLPKAQSSSISSSKTKSATMLAEKASEASIKKELDSTVTPKASGPSIKTEPESLTASKASEPSIKTEPKSLTTPKASKPSIKTEPESPATAKASKSSTKKELDSVSTPKESKVTLALSKSETAISPKASKSSLSSKSSKTSKTKSSPTVCKSRSETSVPSKKSSKSAKESKSGASQKRSACSLESKPEISETEVHSVDLHAPRSRPCVTTDDKHVGEIQFTISMTRIELLATVDVPLPIEATSQHSGFSDYQECVCDLREIYPPPAPRPKAVKAEMVNKQPKVPQRTATTKLICGCTEEQEGARPRLPDKTRPEPCPHYPRPPRRRRRRRPCPPRFCECVKRPPPTPAPTPVLCNLCGGPLVQDAAVSPPSMCSGSGENVDPPVRRISQCTCDGSESAAESCEPPAKRDQGVLAKLPKPEEKRRKPRKQEHEPLEVLFERSTRKAEQFLEALKQGRPLLEKRQPEPVSPCDSCTCPRNHCDC